MHYALMMVALLTSQTGRGNRVSNVAEELDPKLFDAAAIVELKKGGDVTVRITSLLVPGPITSTQIQKSMAELRMKVDELGKNGRCHVVRALGKNAHVALTISGQHAHFLQLQPLMRDRMLRGAYWQLPQPDPMPKKIVGDGLSIPPITPVEALKRENIALKKTITLLEHDKIMLLKQVEDLTIQLEKVEKPARIHEVTVWRNLMPPIPDGAEQRVGVKVVTSPALHIVRIRVSLARTGGVVPSTQSKSYEAVASVFFSRGGMKEPDAVKEYHAKIDGPRWPDKSQVRVQVLTSGGRWVEAGTVALEESH
jgi:hypothetical protein